jgi:hypothetical protein
MRGFKEVAMKKLSLIFIGTILLLTLTSCGQTEEFDEILHIYDGIADNEIIISSLHQERLELKEREQELSRRIISQGIYSNEGVFDYLGEVLESIGERESIVEEQVQVMRMSMDELEQANQLINLIENEEIKEQFLQVQYLHHQRYEAFIELSYSYLETIRRERRFYSMLGEDEQNLLDLESLTMILNQRAITETELQEELRLASNQLNDAINRLARALEEVM